MKEAPLLAGSMRRAGPEDAPALALLGGATFLHAFAVDHPGAAIVEHVATLHSTEWYAAVLRDPQTVAWLVETPLAAPIGYALLTRGEAAGSCELKRLYVLGPWQGAGWGEQLLAAAEGEARARGATALSLSVYGENHAAQRFYARHGFVDTGRRIDFMVGNGAAFVDLILSKPL